MSTALITGASTGIGKAYAEAFAARKSNLVIVARSQDKLEALATSLTEQYQIQVEVIVKDLSQAGVAAEIFDLLTAKNIQIDTLINNAGFGDYGKFSDRDGSRQQEMIQLNISTLVDLTHKFLPAMQQRRSGQIINIASIAAFQPMPYLSVYAATKAFVLSFSEALWAENRELGVQVLCVCPGPTETNFFTEAKFPNAIAAKNNKIDTVDDVIKDTFIALEKNESVVVCGGMNNQIITSLSRFMPRKTLVSLIEKQFRN